MTIEEIYKYYITNISELRDIIYKAKQSNTSVAVSLNFVDHISSSSSEQQKSLYEFKTNNTPNILTYSIVALQANCFNFIRFVIYNSQEDIKIHVRNQLQEYIGSKYWLQFVEILKREHHVPINFTNCQHNHLIVEEVCFYSLKNKHLSDNKKWMHNCNFMSDTEEEFQIQSKIARPKKHEIHNSLTSTTENKCFDTLIKCVSKFSSLALYGVIFAKDGILSLYSIFSGNSLEEDSVVDIVGNIDG